MTGLAVVFVSTISFGFAALVFLAVYGVEDAILNRQLDAAYRAHLEAQRLPAGISTVHADELPANLRALAAIGDRGEGYSDQRYFHYRRIADDGGGTYLLLDATDQLVVRQSSGRLLMLFGTVLIGVLGVTLAAAWWLSSVALRPFEKLVNLVGNDRLGDSEETIDGIRESDVRMLAERFRRTLLEKQRVVSEQLTFNQGISHELRTPLQIIRNSLELLEEEIGDIGQQPSFARLQRASKRMERISSAFLWLTTSDSYTAAANVGECIGAVLTELRPLLDERNIECQLTIDSDLALRVPASVIELMFYNLISNVARHTSNSDLSIQVEHESVTMQNPLAGRDVTHDGFRLGLDIVERLAERFGLVVTHSEFAGQFRTRLATEGGKD